MTKVPDKKSVSGLFDYRNGFAGKHGFIDLQFVRRENGAVCCDLVTGSEVSSSPPGSLPLGFLPVRFQCACELWWQLMTESLSMTFLTRSSCTIPIRELAITTPIKSIFLYWPDKITRPASAKFKKVKISKRMR